MFGTVKNIFLFVTVICLFSCGSRIKSDEEMKELLENVNETESTAKVLAPEISSKGLDRETTIRLSDLKGKVVLIDFWASWCGPCRRENPHVVETYDKYKDKGFDVFSVSLDGERKQDDPLNDWISAVKDDGLIWENHVSDLKGWDSEFVDLYGVRSIPYTVLVDKEGSIITTNIHGNQLDQLLDQILK